LCGLPFPSLSGAANDAENKLVVASTFVATMQQIIVEGFWDGDGENFAEGLISKLDAARIMMFLSWNNRKFKSLMKELGVSSRPSSRIKISRTVVSKKSWLTMGKLNLSILTLPPN